MTDAEYRDLYPALCRAPRCQFPRADFDLIHDAVTDALIDHWRRPWRHDPARLSLERYLRMAAIRNLINVLRRQSPVVMTDPGRAASAEQIALARIAGQELAAWLQAQARDHQERLVVTRWLADAWGAKSMPVDPALGRARDRLVRRLRRASASAGRSAPPTAPAAPASQPPDRRAG